MSIVLTGGGTGGHLAIIAAVKEHLKSDYVYIGSNRGQDRAWFGDDKSFKKCYFLDSKGVMNRGVFGKLSALLGIAKETLRARKILKENDAKVLFCVGGYSAAPASFAALTLGVPLLIHEQNAAIGRLNRILKPFAKAFISSYDEDSPLKLYPIKQIFFDLARKREELKSILIVGGSQGAVALNKLALELAPTLAQKGIKIFHQAGEKNLESVKSEYKKMGIEAEVFGFTKELPTIMQKCDFAIARAGASTLWELVANGLPTLFVPYPYAADNHQYYNAKFLADNDLAYLIEEKSLKVDDVIDILENCDLSAKSEKLLKLIEPNGAQEIAQLLESFNTNR
jgi:UDP-N-acetylglucosamine--N-acetylmuramyl-(pentapeptide) pyrophosphoryl-undecaprenol N-acetylglucosamine transferase